MSESPRLLAGRYEVGVLIGRGGMAEVHAGYDTRLGREVAIKILRSELARDNSFLMRFRREAKSAASLSHPAIVAVFDSGEDTFVESGGAEVHMPFIVMEYVRGRTLRDILHEDGPLDAMRATRIMTQVLRALHYSHEHGIVHRDIKPANVMVGPGDEAKVMDFGIARAIADTAATMTNTSIVVGTAQYLSPEQARGGDVDARSDLYSSGCLLYELLTGRPPFVGDSPVAIAYQHVGEPPQPPSVYAPDVPSDLDVVVLHVLAKDPKDRYQSGDEFADDLEAVLRREPTKAAAAAVAAGALAPGGQGPPTGGATVAPDPDDPDGRAGRRPPWLLPLVLALLALAAIALGILAGRGGFAARPVAVPNVTNKTEAQAKQDVTAAGLIPVSQAVTNAAKPGTVVAQSPDPGSELPPNSNVRLSVSSGPGMVVVPNLRNFQQDTASQRLRDFKLQFGSIKTVDSYEIPENNVVSTEPKAGSKVPEGTAVTLVLSTGKVAVPDVTGMGQTRAAEELSKVGLRRTITTAPSDRNPGTVIDQSYKEGEKVPVGTEVALTVATPRPRPTTTTVTVTPSTPTSPSPTEPPDGSSPPSRPPSPTSTGPSPSSAESNG